MLRVYKPRPEAYRAAARLLQADPPEILMARERKIPPYAVDEQMRDMILARRPSGLEAIC